MQGFISYSHENYDECVRLHTHLKALKAEHGIEFWWDDRIRAGDHWSEAIAKAIDASDLFILAASPDFIASNYIWNVELPAIAARRTSGALILPVVLHRCAWQIIAGALQAVPTIDGRLKPVHKWRPADDGYDQAREQIGIAVSAAFKLASKSAIGGP